MAEAHQAVAFNLAITHEGVHINYDEEVLKLVFQSGLRSYRKRFARFVVSLFWYFFFYTFFFLVLWILILWIFAFHSSPCRWEEMDLESDLVPLCPHPQNNFKTHVYPSSVEFLLCILGLVIGSRVLLEIDTSFGFIDWFESSIISSWVSHFLPHFFSAFFSSVSLSLSLLSFLLFLSDTWFFRIKFNHFWQIFQSKSNHKWIVIMYSIWNHYMVGKGDHHEVHAQDVVGLQRMDVRVPRTER